FGIVEDTCDALDILKNKHSSLVGRKATGEAEGQGIWVQNVIGSVNSLCAFAMTYVLLAYTLADKVNHLNFALLMDRPQFLVWDSIDGVPQLIFFYVFLPISCKILAVELLDFRSKPCLRV